MKTEQRIFPDIDWFGKNVIRPGDNRQYFQRRFYDYYKTKFGIAARYRPSKIAEIGVRLGYSAFAFLWACPDAAYTGFDLCSGRHGGVKGADLEDVKAMLEGNFPLAAINLIKADTQRLEGLGGDYDFIHVDGDHGRDACMHDMEISVSSLDPGGIILVDDYDYIACVKRAVIDFCLKYRSRIKKAYHEKSLRGEFIMEII